MVPAPSLRPQSEAGLRSVIPVPSLRPQSKAGLRTVVPAGLGLECLNTEHEVSRGRS